MLGQQNKQKLKKSGVSKILDSSPGIYTMYKPFLNKDKAIFKNIMSGIHSKRPPEVQTALLRRHLLELTHSFMIPLERYVGSLLPLLKNISPFKVNTIQQFTFLDAYVKLAIVVGYSYAFAI